MICRTCGEEINFDLVEIVARWNDVTKQWDRGTDTYEQPMCGDCGSFDIEDREFVINE